MSLLLRKLSYYDVNIIIIVKIAMKLKNDLSFLITWDSHGQVADLKLLMNE